MHNLVTPFGTVVLRPTSANHVMVDGTARSLNAPDSVDYQPGLVINSVKLSVRVDLSRWADGSWNIGREDSYESQWRGVYATRVDYRNVRGSEASESQRRKIRETLVPQVIEWLESPAGVDMLEEARLLDLNRRIQDKNREVHDLAEALATAKAEYRVLLQEVEA
jgi:hypothetical protein